MPALWKDLRYAARTLTRAPGLRVDFTTALRHES
jgi:hypothetical protein